jgi:hypothetical protein
MAIMRMTGAHKDQALLGVTNEGSAGTGKGSFGLIRYDRSSRVAVV